MSKIWDKFWNDEDFFLRVTRGIVAMAGAFVVSGGFSDILPREVGAGLIGIASMFSGNGRK